MNKTNKILISIICVLVIIIGIFSYNNFFKNTNDKDNNNNNANNVNNIKSRNLTSEEKNNLINVIESLIVVDENEKNLSGKYTIDNQLLLGYGLDSKYIHQNSSQPFSSVQDKVSKNLNVEVTPEDYVCPACGKVAYIYNKSNNTFSWSEDHLGHGIMNLIVKNIYESFSLKDNIYEVKVKKAFQYTSDWDYEWYKSASDAKNNKNIIFRTDDLEVKVSKDKPYEKRVEEYIKMEEERIKENKDLLNTYTYKFKKENNEFKLISYLVN